MIWDAKRICYVSRRVLSARRSAAVMNNQQSNQITSSTCRCTYLITAQLVKNLLNLPSFYEFLKLFLAFTEAWSLFRVRQSQSTSYKTLLLILILIIWSSHLRLDVPNCLFILVCLSTTFLRLLSFPYMLHVSPISSSLIWQTKP
jgi:hypothetical protein